MPSPAVALLGKAAGAVAFAVVLAFGLLYVRLLHGPIALPFLIESMESSVGQELSGLGVSIENVAIRLNERNRLEFELTNVRVADSADVPLAVAPSAAISLSTMALIRGRIAPESVELRQPRLLLFYGEDGKLSLKFSAPGDHAASDPGAGASPTAIAAPAAAASAPARRDMNGSLGRIDLIKALTDASASARRREHASAFLREIGLRSATVILDNGARKSIWRVPELNVDLDHKRSRSSIAGRAKIETLAEPWSLNFRTFEAESTNTLQLAVSVQGLVPARLARTLPQLAALEGFDVPVWGEAKLDLSSAGDILGGNIGIDAAPGRVLLPWLAHVPLNIDGGHMELSYSSATRRFEIAPSAFVWGDSRVQFAGNVSHAAQGPEGPGWTFDVHSIGGWIGADPPVHERMPIDDWWARGFLAPERGRIVLSEFRLRAGSGEVSAQGDVADMGVAMKARLEGRIGPMPAAILKALWPGALAPQSRAWVAQHLVRGGVQGGTFRISTGYDDDSGTGADKPAGPQRTQLTLEGANLAFSLLEGAPLLEVPRALVRLDGGNFEVSVPDAAVAAPDGRRIALKGGMTVDLRQPLPRTGQIHVKGQGPLSLALELLDQKPLELLHSSGLGIAAADGKIEGHINLALPLGETLQSDNVTAEGKVRITDGRLPNAFGPHEIYGANIAIDMTGTAIEAQGEMLVKGVLVKTRWQHVFGVPPERQPELRITTSLDDSDRTQLGLDINDLVQGEIGIDMIVSQDARNERHVHVRADLLNSEVLLESIAWRKPKGRPSTFEFDIVKGSTHPIELTNVKMVGDNVAIEGWIAVGADNKVREFRFPHFSLNVITSLEANGKLRSDGVWDVTAKGSRYDGRDLFRSFFDVAHMGERPTKVRPGLDLRAEVDTVVGYSDGALRNVRMSFQKRLNRMTSLDVRGVLEGGKQFAAVLRHQGLPRRLQAESTDAGQIFKLVGFYPNAVGGIMNLEVNLDGEGAAERTGTLWTKDFHVLGDAIVNQVLQNADDPRPGEQKRRKVVREQFDFDSLRARFSVGHGQFVLHDAFIIGPLVSATLRGKADFRAQALNLGGTYVPMSIFNRGMAPIPLLGPLFTGPRGEGIFGITFAIQGSMADPQVIVNPLSLITPGILRELFQMTPEDPRVLPRERAPARGEPAARASSSAPAGATAGDTGARVQTDIGSDWSAQTNQATSKKK